jgi:hypothetical protein
MKTLAICAVLLLSMSVFSQGITDTLFFTNGSMVLGKLKKIKLGIVTFDPHDANDITVQLRKLRSIGGGSRIFRIEAVNEHLYFGKILAHSESNKIHIATIVDTVTLGIQDIVIMYPFEKSIKQRLSGSVGMGFSYTRSSNLGRLNFDATIRYLSRKTELSLTLSGIYSLYDSLFSRDKEDLYLKYNYYFVRNWFATIFLAYQRNLELGLQRRYQEGLGIGNKFITSKRVYAWSRTGIVINQEKSTEDVSSGVLTELYTELEFNFFRFEKPKINCLLSQSFYYSLSQAGRFRNDGSLSITWELFKDFNLSFEPYNSYDSKPPVEESHNFDYGVVFGIKYIF